MDRKLGSVRLSHLQWVVVIISLAAGVVQWQNVSFPSNVFISPIDKITIIQ